MFDNRFPIGLPTVVTSSCLIAALASALILISVPAASAQAQPTEANNEQIAAPPVDGGEQLLTAREIDEARAELSIVKQKLDSVRKKNTELAARLEAEQVANQQTSEQLEDARTELTTTQRQLAANQNNKENISTQLKQVQEDLDATRKLAGDKEQTAQTLRGELAQLAQTNQNQVKKIETLQTTSGNQQAQLASASREIAALEANIQETNLERQRLGSQLETLQQEIESLRRDKQRVEQSADKLQARYDALRAQLSEAEGGTASEAQLRNAGSEAVSRLREQERKIRLRPSDPDAVKAYRNAVTNLAMRQLRLAWATNARGLYRVRTNDTLALVAKRNYGESGQWTQVFKANRHILDDPDRLMPDMTLLIP